MGNTIANIKDSTLKHNTEYTEAEAAKRGKNPIIAKEITTVDIPTSEVVEDWEDRNNKALTSRRPAIAVNFDIEADFDLLGKVVADLQENTGVSVNSILGTLHYISDYTGFSGDPEEQAGNYLAFMVEYTGDYTSLTVQTDGRTEVTMDPDRTHVQRFPKAPVGKSLTVRAYSGDTVVASKVYDLSQLVLEADE